MNNTWLSVSRMQRQYALHNWKKMIFVFVNVKMEKNPHPNQNENGCAWIISRFIKKAQIFFLDFKENVV
jgi:hypothetical protein